MNSESGGVPASRVDDLLVALFEQVERADASAEGALEALCAANPEEAQELRKSVRALANTGLLEALAGSAHELPPIIDDFEPQDLIGLGGMAIVYRARQVSTGREVALKFLRPAELDIASARARFQREVAAVARLEHAGIVAVVIAVSGAPEREAEAVEHLRQALVGVDPEAVYAEALTAPLHGRPAFEAVFGHE